MIKPESIGELIDKLKQIKEKISLTWENSKNNLLFI